MPHNLAKVSQLASPTSAECPLMFEILKKKNIAGILGHQKQAYTQENITRTSHGVLSPTPAVLLVSVWVLCNFSVAPSAAPWEKSEP